MAENDSDDRTEQASSRRLQQAWDEGQIAISRDLGMIAGLAAGAATLVAVGPALRDSLVNLVWTAADGLVRAKAGILLPLLVRPAVMTLAVVAAVAFGAAVGMGVQTRLGTWAHLALPDFTRVFSAGRLANLFKKDTLIDLLLAAVKVVTLGYILWNTFRDDFLTLPRILNLSPGAQLRALYAPLADGLAKILAGLLVLAGLDFALTRYRFNKRMKMTKEEAKRDTRDEEGDPLIRSRRLRRHRELAKGQARAEVPKADALIVNPTHVAVAIRYRPDKDAAPKVVAKGKGKLAEYMRELAREHGIPIVEDIPLARLLYRRVKVGRSVPVETYKAVAAVLAFVYRVLGRHRAAAARDVRGAA